MTDHYSDCAVHNEPAYPPGPCNCGAGASTPSFSAITQCTAAAETEKAHQDGRTFSIQVPVLSVSFSGW